MLDRDFFFKPYRQKLQEMHQQHDDMQQDLSTSLNARHYVHRSPSYYQINRPWNQQSPQPQFANSPLRQEKSTKKKYNNNNQFQNSGKLTTLPRQMQQPVWQHLYNQGLRVQKQIEEAHKQKQFKIDTQCTFQPLIRKSSRYRIPTSSNFLERNNIWQQNKLQKIVKQKQQQVTKDLEQCTFKPKLNRYHKMINSRYHHLKPSKSMTKIENKTQNNKTVREKQQKKGQAQGFNRQQVGKIKNLIRNELKRIQL